METLPCAHLQVCNRDSGILIAFTGGFIQERISSLQSVLPGQRQPSILITDDAGAQMESMGLDLDLEEEEPLTLNETRQRAAEVKTSRSDSEALRFFRCSTNMYKRLTLQGEKPAEFDAMMLEFEVCGKDDSAVHLHAKEEPLPCILLDAAAEGLIKHTSLWKVDAVDVQMKSASSSIPPSTQGLLLQMADAGAFAPSDWYAKDTADPFYLPEDDTDKAILLSTGLIVSSNDPNLFWISEKGLRSLSVVQTVKSQQSLAEYHKSLGSSSDVVV